MTKDGLTEAQEDVGAMAGGRNGDVNRNRNRYGGGAKDRPAVAVMPLWDRPRTGVCR